MERSGILLNRKYRALLVSTLAMTASIYLSGIFDSIMVGRILGTAEVPYLCRSLLLVEIPLALSIKASVTVSHLT